MRRAAARSQCANHLKMIALALHSYADAHPAIPTPGQKVPVLPAGTMSHSTLAPQDRLSWYVAVLPFIEQAPLHRLIDQSAGWDAEANRAPLRTELLILHCPDWRREDSHEPAYATAYLGVAGLGADAATLAPGHHYAGVFGYDRRTPLREIKDGFSTTLLILESARQNGPWGRGGPATVRGLDTSERPYLGTGRQFGGTHFGENTVFGRGASLGCQAALADGSVRFLSEEMSAHILEALATVAGGEQIGADW